jgi:hypothetical protein
MMRHDAVSQSTSVTGLQTVPSVRLLELPPPPKVLLPLWRTQKCTNSHNVEDQLKINRSPYTFILGLLNDASSS